MKIVVLDGYTENPGDLSWAELEKLGELSVYDRTPVNQVAERIKDAAADRNREIVVSNIPSYGTDAVGRGQPESARPWRPERQAGQPWTWCPKNLSGMTILCWEPKI